MRVVDEAKTVESLKRVSENVTKVYQSGFAHGFAEIEKVVIDDIESKLDNILAIQEELVGIITFTILGETLKALSGMTWSEWVYSEYNTTVLMLEGGMVYWDDHGGLYVINAEGGFVLETDVILDGCVYSYG